MLRHNEVMSAQRKITVILPVKLIEESLRVSGKGLTETIRIALKQVAAVKSYKKLKSLKGKVQFQLKLDEMREK